MTITEIAKLAGVGTYSVSRYFNTPHLLSDKMQKQIQKVVEEHNFELKAIRTGPKSGERAGIKHKRVALLAINGMSISFMRQLQVPNTIFDGLQINLQDCGMALDFYTTGENGEIPEDVNSSKYDGVILYGNVIENFQKLPDEFAQMGVVHAFGGNAVNSIFNVNYIGYDNSSVGTEAANYLYYRGHRKIVIFNPMVGLHLVYEERCRCFCNRANELGIEARIINANSQGFTCPGGGKNYDATHSLATQYNQESFRNWTGCFFCSDRFLLGTCFELAIQGFDINRLDLISCDNTDDFLGFFRDRPASIDIRLEEIAEDTAKAIMKSINHRFKKKKKLEIENHIFKPLLVPKQLQEDEERI